MSKTKIQAGAVLDTLTRDELAQTIDDHTRNWYQEKARGKAPARFNAAALVVSTAVAIPAVGDDSIGPKPGFLWKIERITAAGLGTGDVLQVYRNVAVDRNLLGVCTQAQPVMSGTGKGTILQGEETLVFAGASLAATGYITINGEAIEVPGSDYYALI